MTDKQAYIKGHKSSGIAVGGPGLSLIGFGPFYFDNVNSIGRK